MRKFYILILIFNINLGFSQSLPIDFETSVTTSDFQDFDGGVGTVVSNPYLNANNTSNTVGQIIRNGGKVWAGSKIVLENNLDFSVKTKITMKVYSTAPIGTTVKFKLEGTSAPAEVDAFTTVSGEWETLEWVFLETSNELNQLVFMFDFGNLGDGSATSIFYFDDIEQVTGPPAPIPTTLPINFENNVVTSDFLNYSGATVSVIANPQKNGINTSNTVGKFIKDGGEFWAGSKVLLSNNIDLSTMWQFSMKVYSTAPIGTRIKLELEGPDGKINLDYLTTVSSSWETASWNFHGVTGNYNKINFLFDFGNVGNGSSNSTFLFDDVEQIIGNSIPDQVAITLPEDFENGVLDSDFRNFSGAFTTVVANPKVNANNPSATVGKFVRSGGAPWAQSKINLIDFLDFTNLSALSMKVYTEAPVGSLLKFKVESTEAAFANERNVNTTVSGDWATYTWDFSGDPPVYNVITLMLGYTTPNDASANATFYFDDITREKSTLSSTNELLINKIYAYPNPTKKEINLKIEDDFEVKKIEVFNILSTKLFQFNGYQNKINFSNFSRGVYILKITLKNGNIISKKILKR